MPAKNPAAITPLQILLICATGVGLMALGAVLSHNHLKTLDYWQNAVVFRRLRLVFSPVPSVFEVEGTRNASSIIMPFISQDSFTRTFGSPRAVFLSSTHVQRIWVRPENDIVWNWAEEQRYRNNVVEAALAAISAFASYRHDMGIFMDVSAGLGVLASKLHPHVEQLLLRERNVEDCARLAANIAWNEILESKTSIYCGPHEATSDGKAGHRLLQTRQGVPLTHHVACIHITVLTDDDLKDLNAIAVAVAGGRRGWRPPILVAFSQQQAKFPLSDSTKATVELLSSLYQHYYCVDTDIADLAAVLQGDSLPCLSGVFSNVPLDFAASRNSQHTELILLQEKFVRLLVNPQTIIYYGNVPFPKGSSQANFSSYLLAHGTWRRQQIGWSFTERSFLAPFFKANTRVQHMIAETGSLAVRASDVLLPDGPHRMWTTMHLTKMMDGITVYDGAPNGAWWWDVLDGIWEPTTFHVIRESLEHRGGAYIDIGMWIAPTVLYAGKFASRVIAFEADPIALYIGAANVVLNRNISEKTLIVPRCVSDAPGIMRMRGTGGSVSRLVDTIAEDSYAVSCTTVQSAFANVGVADVALVKIDIEGAELLVLPSMMETLAAAGWPRVWLSLHPPLWLSHDANDTLVSTLINSIFQYQYIYNEKLQLIRQSDVLLSSYSTILLSNTTINAPPLREVELCSLPYATDLKGSLHWRFPFTNFYSQMLRPQENCTSVHGYTMEGFRFDMIPQLFNGIDSPGSVVDIGAGLGTFSLFCSLLGRKVYAFEPDPYMFQRLQGNLNLNPTLRSRITPYQKCLASQREEVQMFGTDGSGLASVSQRAALVRARTLHPLTDYWQVECVSVKEVLQTLVSVETIDLIAIDLAGGEENILGSMLSFVTQARVPMFIRIYPSLWPGHRRSQIMGTLNKMFSHFKHVYMANGTEITGMHKGQLMFQRDAGVLLSMKELVLRPVAQAAA